MAGNVLVVKPAPGVSQSSLALIKIFREAGLPEEALSLTFATVPQIHRMIGDFRVRGVTFTGSSRAGSAIAESAGRHLKKVVLELGGSDPFIILPDAPLQDAIDMAVEGRLHNTGQACIGTKRVIVVGKERGELVLRDMQEGMASLQAGDPRDSSTTVGPVVSERALLGLLEQIEVAERSGGAVALGGRRIARPGFYLEPTILTNISQTNPATKQEFFGPVVSLYVVDSEKEAVELANGTELGLGSSIISKDVEHAKEIADKLEVGMVFINGIAYSSLELPCGRVKNFGKELSRIGFHEFVNKKLVRVAKKF
ncbi:uncharacterized protein Triagg1_1472 [Trichoderma aggressivum f. europaeum]|uniref:Aldehyde dehydrogenase domain-containing protein n=1 Tax=Trichoderma aggressivum f. europaeum TaxID=173218 RepID=A0AAE1IIU3_9HYPO|nr:hypothetical protein Triagg1_1472 [Trichoderma aggressivum f. europaeum]